MLFHQGLNYLANCGPYFATAREVRHPLQDNGSATDQSKYRAAIDRYYEQYPEMARTIPPAWKVSK